MRRRNLVALAVLTLAGAVLLAGAAGPSGKRSGKRDDYETRKVTVRAGGSTKVLTQADLRGMPRVTLENYQLVGVSKGPLRRNTWTGASLKDVLLRVDPRFCDRAETGPAVTIRSQDGWTAVVKWAQVCGTPSGGEALYDIKGCSECHGASAQGTARSGKTPAPRLTGRGLEIGRVLPLLRTGVGHDGIDAYTEARLPEADVADIVSWLNGTSPATPRYVVPPERRPIVLAYLKNGTPMTGRDGLIQLVVGMDEFAGRYSHWVSEIEAEERPPGSTPTAAD